MKRTMNAWDQVNLVAQLADLKDSQYTNTLALSALIEILIEKGVLSPEDFHHRTAQLEKEDLQTALRRRSDITAH
ncbi:hypothetical protein [Paenibacillus thermotolerans]|uniref:hypothetical protein n=1 Tax=Paenibacillus thermotolerans TaxID=3027807 RepID=UPI002368EE77|nr:MULTISPECIES: hypothetical protein [unclassified Paenibacillus]